MTKNSKKLHRKKSASLAAALGTHSLIDVLEPQLRLVNKSRKTLQVQSLYIMGRLFVIEGILAGCAIRKVFLVLDHSAWSVLGHIIAAQLLGQ